MRLMREKVAEWHVRMVNWQDCRDDLEEALCGMAMYLVALAGSFSAAYLLIFALLRDKSL